MVQMWHRAAALATSGFRYGLTAEAEDQGKPA